MRAKGPIECDWRDPAAYSPLLDADRSFIAWEWLRRDVRYRAAFSAAAAPGSAAAEFGLLRFEDPVLPVPLARPFWSILIHPYVLSVEGGGAESLHDLFDPGACACLARLVEASPADHLLLSDGYRAIRLDGPAGLFSAGPVALRYQLRGLASAERPLLTLRRFLGLCRTGSFARSLHPREARARRWILQLRAWDALEAGANQRAIASVLFSRSVAESSWRSREPTIRSQVQRLVHAARAMARGGYRRLLA